ncbi:MAG: phosphoribosyltransferase family protein [Actinomycetota bacterium]
MTRPRRFRDRTEAGEILAAAVLRLVGAEPATVLGIARGGVVVAVPIANTLRAPLDVVVPRKVGAPGNPELGMGAVAPGVRVLDRAMVARLGVADAIVERAVLQAEEEVRRRTSAYRGDRPPPDLQRRVAVLVDDGVATGGTALAAVAWARAAGAGRVLLAVPVAPAEAVVELRGSVDELAVVITPSPFFSVGQWYERFDQVSDEEVRAALAGEG